METIERVFLGLGSNIGDRLDNLKQAADLIATRCGKVVQRSSIYETDPVEFLDQPSFLNAVLEINTALQPVTLMKECLAIEAALGRKRTISKGPRTIDIDLLVYGERIIDVSEPIRLVVPHPAMHLRRFVLEPLAEIAADIIHPVFHQSIENLLSDLSDSAKVSKTSQEWR
ncbi:MAG TPA: 2-amino-4-hydroxy-6-hydroxymethyldihydropteridine diphosphokinase [Blastocatellia bacterium]|nr:2-amino-4-hydroxy-6-hydroxymethyldihydropteridine diphosphokinase [Blastocatellia bacterium]